MQGVLIAWDSSCVYILPWCGYWFLNYLLIYLFLAVLGLRCHTGFAPVAASGGYSLVAVQTSRCSGLSRCGAQASGVAACGLCSCGSQPLEHRLTSCGTWA